MMLADRLFPSQPLGRDIAGSIESVEALSSESLKEYHHGQYVASNAVVSVAGALSHDRVVADVAELIGDFHSGEPASMFPFIDNLIGRTVRLHHGEPEQAHLSPALPALPADDDDRHCPPLLSLLFAVGWRRCRL